MEKTYNEAPKDKEQVELADIFNRYGDDYRRSRAVSYEQLKAMHHIEICRTAKLGGHVGDSANTRPPIPVTLGHLFR